MMTELEQQQLAESIRQQLAHRNRLSLHRYLSKQNFVDIAEVMEHQLSQEEASACFHLLHVVQASEVLIGLNTQRQVECLEALPPAKISRILRSMSVDDAVDILQELSADLRRKILGEMPFDTDTQTLHQLLLESPDTAAGLMSIDFIQCSIDATVGEALALVKEAEEKDFIYYCYLVDTQNRLVGVVSLKRLLIAKEDELVKQAAIFDVKRILLSDDQEVVANRFRRYFNLLAMPVVNDNQELRGIITLDDVIEIIDEESMTDIYQASGIVLQEADERNLLTGPVYKAVKARLPWLSISLVGQLLTAGIIASFHHTVASTVIAFSFLPMLTGLSGNMGTQSDTIFVRGLALNLVRPENIVQKWLRELQVALIIGFIFGLLVAVFSFAQYKHWELSLLLFGCIITALIIAASTGVILPYVIQHTFKQDPAGVGGPFVTTGMDILNYFVYLSLVTFLIDRLI